MRLNPFCLGAVGLAFFILHASSALLYVDVNGTNPVSPYADWSTAATNIQDAIDASSAGDQIWVTNGIYQTGGSVMAGDLTNRVALNKAVTVQSVNGPWVTIIQGAGATNGTAAVRCAWLTNNAALIGFTLKWGATRTSGGDTFALLSGGGVWCASSNAIVANCIIISNTAIGYGGGAYQGTLNNCLISSNGVSANPLGVAVYSANLNNCTIVSNASRGTYQGRLTNCIVYYNSALSGNYNGGAFSYCCTTPLADGAGNFTNAPQLFADGVHLNSTSPCIGAGTNLVTGADIFGKTWANPPSVGCAEFDPSPLITKPQLQLTSDPAGFTANSTVSAQTPFLCWWLKDGTPLQDNGHFSFTQTTNLVASGVIFADSGSYQLVVSNAFGVVTSAVAQLVVHCVDVAGTNPIAPYSTWATAATNIQDAITASVARDIVLVTNGLYAGGGKSMDGVITNRVSVDKAILVQSMNGPNATIIQGAWDPISTNGPGAVRCAWLTNNAILSGFTLCDGATRSVTSSPNQTMDGGGVFGTSANAMVYNCVIVTNFASYVGGGAFSVTLNHCTLTGNHAFGSGMHGAGVANAGSGGGAANCIMKNCLLTSNVADQSNGGGAQNCNATNCAFTKNYAVLYGSGAYQGTFVNCTVANNTAGKYGNYGGAVASATLINCIVYGNFVTWLGATNYASCTFSYSDTDPLPSGNGNMDVDPQLLGDGVHLATTSPCIGAGTASVISGTDIDGQPWNNPPSIGCDEWQPAPVIAVQPNFQVNPAKGLLNFSTQIAGQSPFFCQWSKDGVIVQDGFHYSGSATPNLVVSNFTSSDAGDYQVVISNSFGVVTSQVVQVTIRSVDVIRYVDASGTNPIAPYSTWATAATNIQDAVDAALPGEIVMVTNGIYANGGRPYIPYNLGITGITNRVLVTQPQLTIISVNGYASTIIQGAWDPNTTNGPLAVRCCFLATNGVSLTGFTLRGGATGAGNQTAPDTFGGGVCSLGSPWPLTWLLTNVGIYNCFITSNSAVDGGGAAYVNLNNSIVSGNVASEGGGTYNSYLANCTVTGNHAGKLGGGTSNGQLYNCISFNNLAGVNGANSWAPYVILYCCTTPDSLSTNNGNTLPPFTGDINADPQFLDSFHISTTSPCCGAGNVLYASGTDLDGEQWANPPSMGCDEVVPANFVGPLTVSIQAYQTNVLVNHHAGFWGIITGRAAYVAWSFGDGSTFTNFGAGSSHQWTNSGDYTVAFTAYNNDNPAGISTNTIIHVQSLNVPQLQSVVLTTNGFQFQFAGQTNANYTIQYATNLAPPVAWQTLQAIYYNTESVIQINDSAWTNSARFYRVLAQ